MVLLPSFKCFSYVESECDALGNGAIIREIFLIAARSRKVVQGNIIITQR